MRWPSSWKQPSCPKISGRSWRLLAVRRLPLVMVNELFGGKKGWNGVAGPQQLRPGRLGVEPPDRTVRSFARLGRSQGHGFAIGGQRIGGDNWFRLRKGAQGRFDERACCRKAHSIVSRETWRDAAVAWVRRQLEEVKGVSALVEMWRCPSRDPSLLGRMSAKCAVSRETETYVC